MWTLAVRDLSRTLAEWRISGLTRQRRSQAGDAVAFSLAMRDANADLEIAPGDVVTITHDGEQWFVGRVTIARRVFTGQGQAVQYQVAGPWWYLERSVYQQVWLVGPTAIQLKKGHCFLNQFADGSLMHTGDQLHEALEWAASQAATQYGSRPFTWDRSAFPAVYIPIDEIRDLTVAEVVAKQLRWIPDAVTWWDYSVTPPAFRVARRADLATHTLDVLQDRVAGIDIVARHDLVIPHVMLKYERVDTIDGASIPTLSTDAYPPTTTGEEFGALVATIDLQGASVQSARADLTSEALPTTDDGWVDWLKAKAGWLTDARIGIDALTVSRVPDAPGATPLPNEIIDGQVADWMTATAQSETVTFSLRLSIRTRGDTAVQESRKVTIRINTTDAETGSYSTITSAVQGELPPAGLARVLYDSLSVVEQEGSLQRGLADLPPAAGEIRPGLRLNLTSGREEWATMAAVVQEVVEQIDQGVIQVRFGAPQHLGPRDMVELLRVNRFRWIYTSPAARSGGGNSAAGVQLGRHVAAADTSGAGFEKSRIVLLPNPAGAGKIILDAAEARGLDVYLREVAVCVNGVQKKMLLLCSDPYDP